MAIFNAISAIFQLFARFGLIFGLLRIPYTDYATNEEVRPVNLLSLRRDSSI